MQLNSVSSQLKIEEISIFSNKSKAKISLTGLTDGNFKNDFSTLQKTFSQNY